MSLFHPAGSRLSSLRLHQSRFSLSSSAALSTSLALQFFWMVGDSLKPFPFSPSKKRDSGAVSIIAFVFAAAAASASPFSYCMQGWHYRCLGLDP
ncbi:hypothetical protein KFK09_005483 [Dendrobium nobile]|uniref:Uncharacterized protein n=1 Tax=Dendrobium nobile TaxID=94219 RepID=A0A8T3C0N5_DENNO|nr:hypothetical protein KFK09_005483 [Dendrobium nobile]